MKIVLLFLSISFIVLWYISTYYRCPAYLAWIIELENPFARQNRSDQIIDHIEFKDHMRIIDIGCGPGRVTIPLAKRLGNKGMVVALDAQSEMLKKVEDKADKISNIQYLQGTIGSGLLRRQEYDYALLINVLGEISNQKVALQEIYHSLKPGAQLLITETIFDPHYQRQAKVKKLAFDTGFTHVATFGSWHSYTMKFMA